MPTRTMHLRPALLAIGLATGCLGGPLDSAADDCLAKPNAPSPPGQHWYYHLDRATHRECWYLGVPGAKVRARPQQATTSPERPTSRPVAQPVRQPPAPVATPAPADDEIAPAETAVTRDEATVTPPSRWSSVSPSPAPLQTEPQPLRSINAQVQPSPAREADEEMPLIWPILSPAELAAAEQPATASASLAQLAALLAVVLGLAALVARLAFRFSAMRKRGGAKALEQRSATARREIPRRPAKVTRPRSPAPGMEASVRGLLHELQRLQQDRPRKLQGANRQVA
jgi:hypothetical protein